LIISDTIHFN